MRVKRYAHFGVGEPSPYVHPLAEAEGGEYVKAADIAGKLTDMVRQGKLTPDTKSRIVTLLGIG